MDIQEESEFNETMNLVKAVLERLEFHAFEDVLIWSNEHASKALLRCLKKTLSEFENGHLVLTSSYPKLKHFSVDSVVRGLMTALDQAQERQDNLNREINELEDQLAKAQAVPEGFVLVKNVHPDAIVHNQGLGLFKECQVIYGWDGKSKDFKDALNKGFYHGVKLGAKAVLETAMIETQEPAND